MLTKTSLMDCNIKNQTNLNQFKPNQTSFPLNTKFSAISYPIFIKIGMVISITLWHINMQNIRLFEYACVHSMNKRVNVGVKVEVEDKSEAKVELKLEMKLKMKLKLRLKLRPSWSWNNFKLKIKLDLETDKDKDDR